MSMSRCLNNAVSHPESTLHLRIYIHSPEKKSVCVPGSIWVVFMYVCVWHFGWDGNPKSSGKRVAGHALNTLTCIKYWFIYGILVLLHWSLQSCFLSIF